MNSAFIFETGNTAPALQSSYTTDILISRGHYEKGSIPSQTNFCMIDFKGEKYCEDKFTATDNFREILRDDPDVINKIIISRVQYLLKSIGYNPGPFDGIMGNRTRTAIKSFQNSVGLIPNGVITEALINSLLDNMSE